MIHFSYLPNLCGRNWCIISCLVWFHWQFIANIRRISSSLCSIFSLFSFPFPGTQLCMPHTPHSLLFLAILPLLCYPFLPVLFWETNTTYSCALITSSQYDWSVSFICTCALTSSFFPPYQYNFIQTKIPGCGWTTHSSLWIVFFLIHFLT